MQVSFGHSIIVDSGASKSHNGSFKAVALSDETNRIITTTPTPGEELNIVCKNPQGFKGTGCYITGLAERITQFYDYLKTGMTQISKEDKALSGVVIYAPSATVGNFAKIASNLKAKTSEGEKPLTDINFNKVGDLLKSMLPEKNIPIAKDFRLVATNDMVGCGAGIAVKLANDPAYKDVFKEGFYGAFYMAGGGLGVGTIEHNGKTVTIKTAEQGHNRSITNRNKTIEKDAASVPALIKNYAAKVGITNEDSVRKLIETGNAKIVGQHHVRAEKGEEAATLAKTKLFKKVGQDDKYVYYQLKGVSKEAHLKAFKNSCNKFIDAVANQCIPKINEGVNRVFLTGSLTIGLSKDLKHNPSLYKGKSLETLITERIDTILNRMNNGATKSMKNLYNFKIELLDDLKDNTAGGKVILHPQSKFIGKERGNWLSVAAKALKR